MVGKLTLHVFKERIYIFFRWMEVCQRKRRKTASLRVAHDAKFSIFLAHRLPLNFHIFYFFSRTTKSISTKLGKKYCWGKGIQLCSKKGNTLLQGEIMMKQQNTLTNFKNLLLQNHQYWTIFSQTWYKSALGKGDSIFFKRIVKFFFSRSPIYIQIYKYGLVDSPKFQQKVVAGFFLRIRNASNFSTNEKTCSK